MAKDEAYRRAEEKIEEAHRSGAMELDLSVPWTGEKKPQLTELPESLGRLTQLQSLDLSNNKLTTLPESLGRLTQLKSLHLFVNRLKSLPEWVGQLTQLQTLNLADNQLTALPESLNRLTQLRSLNLFCNQLRELPESLLDMKELIELSFSDNHISSLPSWIGELRRLREIYAADNEFESLPDEIGNLRELRCLALGGERLAKGWQRKPPMAGKVVDLPLGIVQLNHLEYLCLDNNPLNPELAAAYEEGLDAVKRYLRAKAEEQVVLNEAKLILVGEGEVGKSCLLSALRGDPWEDGRPSTHGIEIKPVLVTDSATETEIRLNGWDFGGQRVYRPTHQLFFSAPAVYLVVWKPREGPQQGFVKEWIRLVKHREPDAKIIVVATHGGPKERQPDIDRQEIWDLFGKETVIDFFLVESRPDKKTKKREGIAYLKKAIASVAASLPEMGRSVPKRWEDARKALKGTDAPYLPMDQVLKLCEEHKMDEGEARLFVSISHRLGHLIHYEHDPTLRDIVVLKPDWLSTAISFVLDDQRTREVGHGLVSIDRLGRLWNDPKRAPENRYPAKLHHIFVRLMERFDISYRVAELGKAELDGTSLIAQLVPDIRPESDLNRVWPPVASTGDCQQVQICRIVDTTKKQSATAEGLFYQLIVRLHKYSLGRVDYKESVHWQRGMVLQDDYGARAFLEHIADDIRITVRSPYPERFLAALTYEVKWLVESFWTGMRCEVTVPCLVPQQNGEPCIGLFEVAKLMENKKRNRPEQPCPICNEWQNIEHLLHNAPAARPNPLEELMANLTTVKGEVALVRQILIEQKREQKLGFEGLNQKSQSILSKVDDAFTGLMRTITDEAKEGPRLFSFEPAETGFFDRPKWVSAKFRVTLWCEHSRLPLPALNGDADKRGVYELILPRDWFVKAAPFLKVLTGTLSLVVPVTSSATKFVLDDAAFKGIEKQLDLGQKSLESVLKGGEKSGAWLARSDAPDLERGEAIEAQGAVLRQLQTWLKEKDPGFGGLVRVMNKRQEFLWVHSQFETEY